MFSEVDGRDAKMIRKCIQKDFDAIFEIINDGALAYKGVIPGDCWHEPYMTKEKLSREIEAGVVFWGHEQNGQLDGVMGIQGVQEVALIRHAYVKTARRHQGIGGRLLEHLCGQSDRLLLVGTWAAAEWAVHFYEKYGFRLVSLSEKERLLRKYWVIPDRQIETSVVLTKKSNGG
jgi:N-acetylglutamate synthase-like GNAT family acetyltransferase